MEHALEAPVELQVVVVLEDLRPGVEALTEGLQLAAGAVVPVAELCAKVLPEVHEVYPLQPHVVEVRVGVSRGPGEDLLQLRVLLGGAAGFHLEDVVHVDHLYMYI